MKSMTPHGITGLEGVKSYIKIYIKKKREHTNLSPLLTPSLGGASRPIVVVYL
jgi:hypothetical protein